MLLSDLIVHRRTTHTNRWHLLDIAIGYHPYTHNDHTGVVAVVYLTLNNSTPGASRATCCKRSCSSFLLILSRRSSHNTVADDLHGEEYVTADGDAVAATQSSSSSSNAAPKARAQPAAKRARLMLSAEASARLPASRSRALLTPNPRRGRRRSGTRWAPRPR